jgi:nucleoid-associated protein YgaU
LDDKAVADKKAQDEQALAEKAQAEKLAQDEKKAQADKKAKPKVSKALVNMMLPSGTNLVVGQHCTLTAEDEKHMDKHFKESRHLILGV